ncbi:branched-chain-amino-acid aminotransferase 3 [Pyrus ussuriensis x Pyrus communis]|uniref:Branched-chain-amino-acid aminotransferase n=1 Tax=Pyrus ussuriensis x Pyrus communis TaxID=2448454 RepID=A0A5N5GQ00_9ROSA|nr:branched-chain-amino-acid aminotransferase 3 [Pyrus ussuriensis x Pyrus communis]
MGFCSLFVLQLQKQPPLTSHGAAAAAAASPIGGYTASSDTFVSETSELWAGSIFKTLHPNVTLFNIKFCLKAYRKEDGTIHLFRPEENALRMRLGAERMCMPSPTVEQFVEAVKATVLANKRWVPPPGKGSLFIRPLLMGSGAVLGLAPAPEYTFLIYVSPVGNYFQEGVAPINLIVEHELHRATPGGTGGVKTIGNYAAVLKAQSAAKAKGYSDVLYLDCVHKKYLEEVSLCNIFVVKDNVISTPAIKGTILPGVTRKSIIDVARSEGFQVEERQVAVEDLLDADEVFCTGTAVVVSPVGSITYLGKRICYGDGFGVVSEKLYSVLTRLQMGLSEDKMDWTVELR